ncbi:MAG: DNA-deoxyinosine glycosylase, partial [Gammaproteobacteria bacterium]
HFFAEHPLIKAVYFNGSRAQQEFNKHVLPTLDECYPLIQYQRLPSTSPAMASLSREQKLQQWKRVLEYLN